jgi:hypothetical protein
MDRALLSILILEMFSSWPSALPIMQIWRSEDRDPIAAEQTTPLCSNRSGIKLPEIICNASDLSHTQLHVLSFPDKKLFRKIRQSGKRVGFQDPKLLAIDCKQAGADPIVKSAVDGFA